MHGWINNIIENYVLSQDRGTDLWQTIKIEAGCQIDNRCWVFSHDYPDELTYKLLSATAPRLKLPEDELLRCLGGHLISYSRYHSH